MFRPWYRDIEGLEELEKQLVQSTDNNVIPLILNIKKKYRKKISSVPPTNIPTNSCFIVDLSKLKNPEDVRCDDLGAWSQSVTGKKYYKVHKTDSICNLVTKTEKNTPGSIEVIHRPHTNKSDESLKKVTVCISNSNCQFPLFSSNTNSPVLHIIL